ncbi:hypothetical protein VTL71DRAFT_14533 [Oculimacula yallundae]|uniref:RapZ C-terminal domain-containing protein n=1 Tax=Oculimacula yallundae TaxID=86028 RepID=A0ABR4CJA2_9HELO
MSYQQLATSSTEKEPLESAAAIEENNNLPEYEQNALEDVDLPVLILISHGHAPPLKPPPQLKFDVRNLTNPPKHIRDAYNGTSSRLQEWMLSDDRFVERRDIIRKGIQVVMMQMFSEREKGVLLKSGQTARTESNRAPRDQYAEKVESEDTSEDGDETSSEVESSTEHTDETVPPVLRVGIFCAMGRHRSVAMVEELAKMSWPGWQVEVQHRDLNKKRGRGKQSSGKESRGNRGGGIPSHFEDD